MKNLISFLLALLTTMFCVPNDALAGNNQTLSRVRRSEAKLKATTVYTECLLFQSDKGKFPDKAGFEKILLENTESGHYKVGTIETDPTVKAICPDCRLTGTSFKFAIYGNIDDDKELDIITMNEKKELMLVKDDLGESKVPLNLMK
jgi:hypothetical protein